MIREEQWIVNLKDGVPAIRDWVNQKIAYLDGKKQDSTNIKNGEGVGSIVENFRSGAVAHGDYSHAESGSKAYGTDSHAENLSIANGIYSHSEGFNTNASGQYQHVSGRWNIVDPANKLAVIVGNGSAENKRSNAMTLDWDGNAVFSGKVTALHDPETDNDVVTLKFLTKNTEGLSSQVQADADNVLTGITIKNGIIVGKSQTSLNSSVEASKGNVLSGITIKNGKITAHKEFSITSLYRFKGIVATENDLPTANLTNGDVYSITARSSFGMPNQNVAWSTDHWDPLGPSFTIDPLVIKINGGNQEGVNQFSYSGNGQTINITKALLGLDNVSNTPDGNRTVGQSVADSQGQQINKTYIKNISSSGTTVTFTKGDNSTFTFQTQDTNTTYPLYFKTIDGSYKTKARSETKGNADNGDFISVTRNNTASIDGAPQYGSGLLSGREDTQMYLYTRYDADGFYVGGGNKDALNWVNRVYTTGYKPSKADVGLGNVENKSSATIRSELTKDNVVAALGYTPPTSSNVTNTKVASAQNADHASNATVLETARTINGTSFDGSKNITTANWGTARNIYIADADATNTSTAVSVNGGGNATLRLPSTIKASITGNASSASALATAVNINGTAFNGSAGITTANWGTARTLTIGNSGKSVNGSGNVSWTLAEMGALAVSATCTDADIQDCVNMFS